MNSEKFIKKTVIFWLTTSNLNAFLLLNGFSTCLSFPHNEVSFGSSFQIFLRSKLQN